MATVKEAPDEVTQAQEAPHVGPETYVLEKNFGPVVRGTSYFWPAGSEFTIPEDGETLTLMFSLGASLKRKAV